MHVAPAEYSLRTPPDSIATGHSGPTEFRGRRSILILSCSFTSVTCGADSDLKSTASVARRGVCSRSSIRIGATEDEHSAPTVDPRKCKTVLATNDSRRKRSQRGIHRETLNSPSSRSSAPSRSRTLAGTHAPQRLRGARHRLGRRPARPSSSPVPWQRSCPHLRPCRCERSLEC